MKKEYKNFGRVKISSYIYYVIMREMKQQETTLEDIKSKLGYFDEMGINPFTNKMGYLRKTNKQMKKMLDTIKSNINGKWHHEPLENLLLTPIKVPVGYDTETTWWADYLPDNFLDYKDDNLHLQIFPFDDGLMVHSLSINESKRGKGIGTDVMNKLYDISEDMEIPLYIIPYPAGDKFDQSKILDIVNPLHKWYDKLGFGHLEGRGLLWSNY